MLQSKAQTHGYHDTHDWTDVSTKMGRIFWSEFIRLLAQMVIKDVCAAVWSPQLNAICERMHQTIWDILRVALHTNPPTNMDNANQVMDNALTIAIHVTRCTASNAIWTTPDALVYGRDMIIGVPLIANLSKIRDGRQQMIDENLRRPNEKIEHHYWVGDRVEQIVWNKTKLSQQSLGPFCVLVTHCNGNITI